MMQMAKDDSKAIQDEAAFERAHYMHDFNPSQLFDEKGRLKRWVKDPIEYQPMIKPCCGDKRHPTNLQHDLVYVDKLELFNSRLYDDIDFRTRAMKNW